MKDGRACHYAFLQVPVVNCLLPRRLPRMAKGISRSFYYLIGYFCANLVELRVRPLSSSDNLFVFAVVVRFCFAQPETYGFLPWLSQASLGDNKSLLHPMQNDRGFH